MSFGEGNLRERVEDDGRRIAELESLVRDMYESLWTVSETWAYDLYHDRMVGLGIEEEGGA